MKSLRAFICYGLLILGLSSCSHLDKSATKPALYHFPSEFFVEQKLTVESTSGTQELWAQLERRDERIKLVLTDALTAIVLTQIELHRGKAPKVLYLAPILIDRKFPGEQISEAIQYLYERDAIARVDQGYSVVDPQQRWQYSWQTLRGIEPCAFPETISLSFKDGQIKVIIALKELDCSL